MTDFTENAGVNIRQLFAKDSQWRSLKEKKKEKIK